MAKNGIRLGQWLANLRSRRRNSTVKACELTDKQIARLDAIGMVWENVQKKNIINSYENGLSHLAAYIEEYHITDIPNTVICEDGYRFGVWIANCRAKYRAGKISEEYIEKFKNLGIILEKIDLWEIHFDELKRFIET